MFYVSSRILILSVVCILVTGAVTKFDCYSCISVNGSNSLCDLASFILTEPCNTRICAKHVEYLNDKVIDLHRYCSTNASKMGCLRKHNEPGKYTETCYCNNEPYCNKAEKFTWSLFVNLPLVVSSLFGMF